MTSPPPASLLQYDDPTLVCLEARSPAGASQDLRLGQLPSAEAGRGGSRRPGRVPSLRAPGTWLPGGRAVSPACAPPVSNQPPPVLTSFPLPSKARSMWPARAHSALLPGQAQPRWGQTPCAQTVPLQPPSSLAPRVAHGVGGSCLRAWSTGFCSGPRFMAFPTLRLSDAAPATPCVPGPPLSSRSQRAWPSGSHGVGEWRLRDPARTGEPSLRRKPRPPALPPGRMASPWC